MRHEAEPENVKMPESVGRGHFFNTRSQNESEVIIFGLENRRLWGSKNVQNVVDIPVLILHDHTFFIIRKIHENGPKLLKLLRILWVDACAIVENNRMRVCFLRQLEKVVQNMCAREYQIQELIQLVLINTYLEAMH